ncbi:hypothetical protein MPER_04618 [Moniliophthora perniciosa FA553]|nr:hypothetical protein MPER_04618 [Moniliophthora perniciosa FA553]
MESFSDKDKAYDHWAVFILSNIGGFGRMRVENFTVTSGKLHREGESSISIGDYIFDGLICIGDKDSDVDEDKYNGTVIGPGEKLQINACGSGSHPSGSSGKFDLLDPDEGDKLIRHFVWDCPFGSETNTWDVSGSNTKWMVEFTGGNINGGALGNINIDCLKKVEI